MMIFLDTEFTNLPERFGYSQPSLISIGMISDVGKSFYGELSEGRCWHRGDCSPFVLEHVLPNLTGPSMSREALQQAVRDWFVTLPNDLIIAVDCDLDMQFLLAVMGDQPPANLPRVAFKVNSICDSFNYDVDVADYFLPGMPRHHALHDAGALRLAYTQWLTNSERMK